ncbi:MAG: MATE family efflux transporter [Defluviitaleaceae bacterium]|nr:MATE family efflux transporter [Defluviitaleaceae bacterium]
MEHSQSLDKKITVGFLLKFALPTIISLTGMGIFGVIDGIFAARYIDAYALSAVGLIWPFMMFALAIGFLFGVGGNVLAAKEIGEGHVDWARADFTLVSIVAFLSSAVITAIAAVFPDIVLSVLGVNAEVHHLALEYLMPLLAFLPLMGIGVVFQQFLITEGKAHIGMAAAIAGGLLGVYLNWLLIYRMGLGLHGAAISTGLAYTVPAVVGFVFFVFNRRGTLYFVRPKLKIFVLLKSAQNGMSEMVTMMSSSITITIMNNVLMDIDGPMAVAAAGIMGAGLGIAANVYIGYSSGIVPIISYNYGKGDTEKLKKIFKTSIFVVSTLAIAMLGLTFAFTDAFIQIYDIDPLVYIGTFLVPLPIYDMAFTALRMASFGFVFMALNSFASIFFTALNDGIRSAMIAACNGFIFITALLLIFSSWWGVTGVWIAIPMADVLTILVSVYLLMRYRKVYNYI